MKKILEFLCENFQVLVVKFSIYLNRPDFVMEVIFILQPSLGELDNAF